MPLPAPPIHEIVASCSSYSGILNLNASFNTVKKKSTSKFINKRNIRERYGNRKSLLERADQSILRWFGHLESIWMDD